MNLLKWMCVYGILSKGPVESRLCGVGPHSQLWGEGGQASPSVGTGITRAY